MAAAAAATVGAFAVGGLAVAGAGLGYTIASGEDAKRKQANALSKQESAQTQAVSAAERQRQTSEMAINQANRKKPDVSSIMQAAGESASGMPTEFCAAAKRLGSWGLEAGNHFQPRRSCR